MEKLEIWKYEPLPARCVKLPSPRVARTKDFSIDAMDTSQLTPGGSIRASTVASLQTEHRTQLRFQQLRNRETCEGGQKAKEWVKVQPDAQSQTHVQTELGTSTWTRLRRQRRLSDSSEYAKEDRMVDDFPMTLFHVKEKDSRG
ncbi:hypothetical protein C0Q70_01581 [Pomacea canaliculata]|uniref:Uncharacterized protein n=1 Tax=Pomacea canaliculata TaxID=400727 RepID=A0A2T7PZV2_POMCA|nr:hypothetical protein C0Q70_01581 [Pomacea canaliculata]